MKGQVITVQMKMLSGPTVSTQIGLENNVYDLKIVLGQTASMNQDTFRLIYNNRYLKLNDQLQHYGFQNNTVVHGVYKMGHVCIDACRNGGHPPPYYTDPEL